jgi:hypothetical protein
LLQGIAHGMMNSLYLLQGMAHGMMNSLYLLQGMAHGMMNSLYLLQGMAHGTKNSLSLLLCYSATLLTFGGEAVVGIGVVRKGTLHKWQRRGRCR